MEESRAVKKSREARSENKMGTMPIGRLIMTMSGPAIFTMFIQAFYNIVDSIFIAHLSERALEALTIAFPVQLLMIAVGVGTGVGINSLIARSLGAGDFKLADQAASTGVKLAFFGGAAFALFGVFFSGMFVRSFSSDDYVINSGSTYLMIVCIFSIFVMITTTNEKIIQATGNMTLPMISGVVGAVVNILLDPVLIFGLLGAPKLGMAGAALATGTAQVISMTLCTFFLFKKIDQVKPDVKQPFSKKVLKGIYGVGAPAIMMQAIASVMLFGMNAILAWISGTAVAVMGAYGRLQSFIFMPVLGINQGAMPVMGYNYGARNRGRLMSAYKTSFFIAFCIMFAGFILFQTCSGVLLNIFDPSPDMIRLGIPALRRISICFIPASFGIITSGMFQATGHGIMSLMASLLRQLLGILPTAYLLARFGNETSVWWAFALSEIIGVVYSVLMVRFLYNNKIKHLEEVSL